jgi:hypothetical protein
MVPYASSSVKVLRALMYWLRSARLSRVSSTWEHVCGGGGSRGHEQRQQQLQ